MKKMLVLVLILLAAAVPSAAQARQGVLDPSFGRGGKVSKPVLGAATTAGSTSIATSGGRIFLLSGQTLLALKPNGDTARGFGTRGRVRVQSRDAVLELVDVAADPAGRIIVGGTVTTRIPPPGFDWRDESLFLARFTQAGTLDKAFGDGGALITDLGAPPPSYILPPGAPSPSVPPSTRLGGIGISGEGQIVLSGVRVRMIGPCRGFVDFRFRDGFAARLLGDGAPDPSFGQQGVALIEKAQEIDPPALTPAGAPYLWSSPDDGCLSATQRLTRLDRGGAPSTFGENGSLILSADPESGESESAIALDRRGRVLVMEEDVSSPPATPHVIATVRRFLPDGQRDQSFGRNGVARLSDVGGNGFSPSALAVDRLGRIFVAGVPKNLSPEINPRAFLLGRLGKDGGPDSRFADRGVARIRLGRRARVEKPTLVLTNRGALVAGALANPTLSGGEGVALARFASR
jgi:uncharacterized delta-60 repeat protein